MAGKRIHALVQKGTWDSTYEMAIDKNGQVEAFKMPLSMIGNAWMQGSLTGVAGTWHDGITATDLFFRFSTDGGTTWVNHDVIYEFGIKNNGLTVATIHNDEFVNYIAGSGINLGFIETATGVDITITNTQTQYSTFLSLLDTPSDYTGYGSSLLAVKSDASGVEFVSAATLLTNPPNDGNVYGRQYDQWVTIVNEGLDGDLVAIANLTESSGILRKIGDNNWTLDQSSYITANQTVTLSQDVTGAGATAITSTVVGIRSKTIPTLSTGYLRYTGSVWEFKNETYSLVDHTHVGLYEPYINKTSAGYLRWTGSTWSFVNETYSLNTHNHDGIYSPTTHTHTEYEPLITPKSTGYLHWTGSAWNFVNLTTIGDVTGASSSNDEIVVRFDGTTGKLIQGSTMSITDDGRMVNTANDALYNTLLYNNNATGGGLYLQVAAVGTSPIATLQSGANKRFEVLANGAVYAPAISAATASNILYFNQSTGLITYGAASAGTGDVSWIGVGSSTDNAIARFDGTTGKIIQNSAVIINDLASANNLISVDASHPTYGLMYLGNTSSTGGGLYINAASGNGYSLNINNYSGTNLFRVYGDGRILAPNIGGKTTEGSILWYNSDTGRIVYGAPPAGTGGGGDVFSSITTTVDMRVARFDQTTGKLIKDSLVSINNSGLVAAPGGYSTTGGAFTSTSSTLSSFAGGLQTGSTNFIGLNANGYVSMTHISLPTAPGSGVGKLYMNNADGKLYFRTSTNIYDLTASGSGMTNPMTTVGDLIYASTNGSPATAQRLGIGSAGQILTVVGGIPQWANAVTGFTNPMEAIGDIIIGSTGGTAIRLAGGSSGQVLTMSGGSPQWTTISGSGTVTNVAVITANGLTGTVANPTTTPAITLSTTVTGMLKGSSNAIVQATANTDYVLPSNTLTINGTTNQITSSTSNPTNIGTTSRTWTLGLASNPVIPGTAGMVLPIGTTAERAVSPSNGTIRYNSSLGKTEFREGGNWVQYGTGTGSVTSVGLEIYSDASMATLEVQNSPITTSGSLLIGFVTQAANTIFAGPSSGGAAVPDFRSLNVNDLPNSGVVEGNYTNANVYVDVKGRITSISNGAGGGFTNPMDTLGDMIYYGAVSNPQKLAKGTANQVLQMLADGSLPAWRTLTYPSHTLDSHSNVSLATKISGDTIIWNGTNWIPSALPINYWTRGSGYLYPTTSTDRLLVGTSTDNTYDSLQLTGGFFHTGSGWRGSISNAQGLIYGYDYAGAIHHLNYRNSSGDEVRLTSRHSVVAASPLTGGNAQIYLDQAYHHNYTDISGSSSVTLNKLYRGDTGTIFIQHSTATAYTLTLYGNTDGSGNDITAKTPNGSGVLTLTTGGNGYCDVITWWYNSTNLFATIETVH